MQGNLANLHGCLTNMSSPSGLGFDTSRAAETTILVNSTNTTLTEYIQASSLNTNLSCLEGNFLLSFGGHLMLLLLLFFLPA
jgi:hypothetical protein